MFIKKRCSVYKIVAVILAALNLCWIFLLSSNLTANAEEDVEPYGIYTNISLSISGNNGQIYATAKNEFTLGNSIIQVNLYLYSSETYTEDYNLMRLEGYDYIYDLDQGKTFQITASTCERQIYWCAVMQYKHDKREWVEKQTRTVLFSSSGSIKG